MPIPPLSPFAANQTDPAGCGPALQCKYTTQVFSALVQTADVLRPLRLAAVRHHPAGSQVRGVQHEHPPALRGQRGQQLRHQHETAGRVAQRDGDHHGQDTTS